MQAESQSVFTDNVIGLQVMHKIALHCLLVIDRAWM